MLYYQKIGNKNIEIMARLTYEQISVIQKKAFENLRVLLERYPTEEEKEIIDDALEKIIPKSMIYLISKTEKEFIESYNNLSKVVSEIQDDLDMCCDNRYIFYNPNFSYNPNFAKQLYDFAEKEKKRIAKKKEYLKILDKKTVMELLYENVTFTPTSRKDMCDILNEVVEKTFADIKANPDKYFEK